MYWTDPDGAIPNRILLETIWRGGFRHGDLKTKKQKDYDRWWRKRASQILRAE